MVVWPLRNQGVLDRGKEMTSRSSPWAKNVWSKLPEKQSGLPRSLRSLARTSGPLRFKKNDVLGRAYPSASRKMTFWDERTPPLQEKRRFRTSVPLRFKKNDVLGRADPSASLLQSGNFKIYSFFICLLNEKMTSITKIKAIALTKLNNAEYGAFMDSWKIKKNPEGCSGSFFYLTGEIRIMHF